MKQILSMLALVLITAAGAMAQNNVGINNSSPAASAALMVDTASTGPQGLLAPRMTQARRNAIASPAIGLLIYQTDNTSGFYSYNGTGWLLVGSNAGPSSQLYATSTLAQAKTMYGYNRYTFNFDNVNTGLSPSSSAWTSNNTYTIPAGLGGLYQINLSILLTAYTYTTLPTIYPEIQVTSGSNVTYYYGVANSHVSLSGNGTDATSVGSPSSPYSYGRSAANVTVPLLAGDVIKIFIRSSQSATSTTQTVSFSTDGSTYLNIIKLN